MLAVFFCVAAIGLERTFWTRPDFRRPMVVFLCLATLANLGITVVITYHLTEPVRYFFGLETAKDFLRREARSQGAYEWLNQNPAVGKVVLVGLYGPYYLERIAYFSSFGDPPMAEVLSSGSTSPRNLATRFQSLGITHMVINQGAYERDHRNGLYSWSRADRQLFEDFVAEICEPVARFGNETIYSFPRAAGKPERPGFSE
jgi:hypothetical protein